MTSAEIYKLRNQRTPLFHAALLFVGVLIPSIVLIWYTPKESSAYAEAFTATFDILCVLLAIEFGGWLLGSEYRHGTVKRMLASEPRRVRALATKAIVGSVFLSGMLAAAAGVGWTASRMVGSMHDVTVPWNGRTLLAAGVWALAAFVVAYSLSAITRSDTHAKVGTLALIIVVEPLIALIPKVGKYTLGSALESISQSVSGSVEAELATLSTGAASATLAVWITAFVVSGTALFARRDA